MHNIPVIFKAEFSTSLLQSHDPSEIIQTFWFGAQKTFLIIIIMLFFQVYLMNRKFRTAFIWNINILYHYIYKYVFIII